ncbi:hypothetical protein O7634_22470 [Micromonospora sp. WMMD1120]|uniref:hypothetical protein n=1 Tax=Micromonospora sp. WMMD1120 TaxID=3016106 RepID=UPI002416E98B|nr:hypothetical protein [Micromonospora sp. WMMD1120]MDG4809522.1 hypothetical protein [Micromonospora sp. WMMD1120]
MDSRKRAGRLCPPSTVNSRISIEVTTADPRYAGAVQTRVVIDGRPIVAENFTEGPAEPPEYLLGPARRLRARAEPHEVRLAEAECTVGCCGALYVTIQRHGGDVVWRDWRNPDDIDLAIPAFTFDATQYDAEIHRAESDRAWEWHERTVARIVHERLTDEPELLARWDCRFGWAAARPNDRERIHVACFSPRLPAVGDDRQWLEYLAVVGVPPGDPATVADDIVQQLCANDPRSTFRLVGGA